MKPGLGRFERNNMTKKNIPVIIPDNYNWLKDFCWGLYKEKLTDGIVHYGGNAISTGKRCGRLMAKIRAHGYSNLQPLEGEKLYVIAWFDNLDMSGWMASHKQDNYERTFEIENFDKLIFEICDKKSLCTFHY